VEFSLELGRSHQPDRFSRNQAVMANSIAANISTTEGTEETQRASTVELFLALHQKSGQGFQRIRALAKVTQLLHAGVSQRIGAAQ